jgi:3-phytase
VPAHGIDNAAGEPSDAAIWVHPTDVSRSVIVTARVDAPLALFGRDGRRIGGPTTVELDHVDVSYAFPLRGEGVDLIVGHDRKKGTIVAFSIDPDSLALTPLSTRAIEVRAEVTGLCSYRSPITGAFYAFVVTGEGLVQQWELFERHGSVEGSLARVIPVGVGAGYCAVDTHDRSLYVIEGAVGIWKLMAEPETDAERHIVDVVGPRGSLTEEVKGIAIYRANESESYLLAADVTAERINVYSTRDAQYRGSFALRAPAASSPLREVEGLTATSRSLGDSLEGGMIVIADQDTGYQRVAWKNVASALALSSAQGADLRAMRKSQIATVMATVETAAVDDYGDAADDPAIWVHPTDSAQSVIIGTDKKRGLYVYDLSGKTLQMIPDGRINNVDLRHGFNWGRTSEAIVAVSNRTNQSLALYKVNPTTRKLESVGASIASGFRDPYGLCMYRSAKSGDVYVFMNDSDNGAYKQWLLRVDKDRLTASVVREFTVGSQAEGCAADDETGALYIAEEDIGLWRYEAEPDGADRRVRIDDTTERGHLRADVEGVSIYYGERGEGYLIVSNQGADNYAIYGRGAGNAYIGHFAIVANPSLRIDGASETDGLDVISTPLGTMFPFGVFVAQDGRNITPSEPQNFKLVPWERIAAAMSLQKSTGWNPNRAGKLVGVPTSD